MPPLSAVGISGLQAGEDVKDASAIMAIGYDADEKFFLRSAGLDNKEALWLLEDAKEHVRDISEAAHE